MHKITHLMIAETEPDYISITEYIRRRHAKDLEKDPTAKPLWSNTVNAAIIRGDIEIHMQGRFKFIDWNKAKDVLFRRYGEIPVKSR